MGRGGSRRVLSAARVKRKAKGGRRRAEGEGRKAKVLARARGETTDNDSNSDDDNDSNNQRDKNTSANDALLFFITGVTLSKFVVRQLSITTHSIRVTLILNHTSLSLIV